MLEIVRILSSSFNDTHWQLHEVENARVCSWQSPQFLCQPVSLPPVLWLPCDCYSDSLPSVLRPSLNKNFWVSLQLKTDKMWKIQCLDCGSWQPFPLLPFWFEHCLWHPTVCDSSCPLLSRPSHAEGRGGLLLLKLEGWRRREYVKIFFSKYNVSTVSILFSVQVSIQHFTLQTITPIVKLVSPGGAEEWIIFEYVMKCIESVNLLLHSRNLLCSDLLKMLYYSWQGNLMADINTWTGFRILPTPTTDASMLGHNPARGSSW